MGIQGLLPLLKKASKKSNIRQFSGQVAAVDGFCWLHRGAFGCAQKLGLGEPTNQYVIYFMKYVNLLRENGVRPVLVFDGRGLPSKEVTNAKRREAREENRKKAKEALRLENKREAWECFQKSVEITHAMVRDVIKVLRQEKLDYIVSPYEADAQLAFLFKHKMVDFVITEDSDLVLFGCEKIFFKMNINGDGVVFDNARLHLCMDQTVEKFSFEKFRQMCIFSGCDYLESLPGIGLARAKKVLTNTTANDVVEILKQAPKILKMDVTIDENYIFEFKRAEKTFLYQLVYDPKNRKVYPFTEYPVDEDMKELSYCGVYESASVALNLALGNIDGKTMDKVDDFNVDSPLSGYTTDRSIWSKNYKHPSKPVHIPTNKDKSPSTLPVSKTLTVSTARVFKTRNAELNDTAKKRELTFYEMSSASTKRVCLRSDSTRINSKVPSSEVLLQKSNPFSIPKEDSPYEQKFLAANGTLGRRGDVILRPVLSTTSPQKTTRKSPRLQPSIKPFLCQDAVVIMEKLDISSKCSGYFTEGNQHFIGNKNHPLYCNAGKRKTF